MGTSSNALQAPWSFHQQPVFFLTLNANNIFYVLSWSTRTSKILWFSQGRWPTWGSAHIFKCTAHSVAPSTTKLFNLPGKFSSGHFPKAWKLAIAFVPKSNNHTSPIITGQFPFCLCWSRPWSGICMDSHFATSKLAAYYLTPTGYSRDENYARIIGTFPTWMEIIVCKS